MIDNKLKIALISMIALTFVTPLTTEAKKRDRSCDACQTLDGFIPPSEINDNILKMVGKFRGADKKELVSVQKERGVIETGLEPVFIDGGECPEIDSETWAIDYSYKRPWPALHKGIDIPQPKGTPILAISDGVVVGKFENKRNRKGIEIVLRHAPEQTGLPFWVYSQYTHMQEMSSLSIGDTVKMGDEIGKTSNTGKMGRRIRRDALHFAIFYSQSDKWSNNGRVFLPQDGFFMDPVAFYRLTPPYDSPSLVILSSEQKKIPVPYIKSNGALVPSNTKRIWPYVCE